MKNVSLVEITTNKIKSWKLIGNNGVSLDYFDSFASILLKKYSTNTRLSYCRGVALFVDYLEDVGVVFVDCDFTQSFLVDVIESFPEWLLYGEQSGNEIAVEINKSYPSPLYSRASIDLIMASVRLFLSISERVRLVQEDLEKNVSNKLFENISQRDCVSINQTHQMKKKTMLGGVLANGSRLLKSCILPIKKSQPYFSLERAFPFGKVLDFVDSLTSYRDKTLYMFCAASGCRIHEALQLLIEDISIKDRSVVLIDPFSRITNHSYRILSAEDKTRLSWKGRQTDRTLLIQPFGDLFFEYLEKYIREEYIHHNKHTFVFQHIRGVNKGKPYFLSAASTRHEAFKKAVDIVELGDSLNQGVHSLRHMYGTYLVNYFPKSDGGYGLPIAIVQKIMGHSTMDATQKYARHDKDLMAVELEYANSLIYQKSEMNSLIDLKKKVLIKQLLDLENYSNEL